MALQHAEPINNINAVAVAVKIVFSLHAQFVKGLMVF